jgi:signal transduction histidine kinase
MRRKLAVLSAGKFSAETLEVLMGLQEKAVEQVAKAKGTALSPLEVSDREQAVEDWLDDRDVPDPWKLAPTFVQAGLDPAWLDLVEAAVDAPTLIGALGWLNYTVETELLMNEIEDATTRISALVDATKQYSQLDRAPYRRVDLHELLDSTLVMLGGKIPPGVRTVKEYDRGLPEVPCYPGELNQVWTNLIDNALAAMGPTGTLTVRTARDADDEHVLVDVCDTGPGVPEEIRERIFEPFFTTKPVGQGTGLGLDISWRIVVDKHHGDLRLDSRPGDTRFRVRLPLRPQEDPS